MSSSPPTAGHEPAILLEQVSKQFQIYAHPADRLRQMLHRGRRRYYREFPAVRDLNLRIQPGETVGIVGRNGSGKSTLLQLICGTLQPSSGHLQVRGRVSALLELGAGFNPEFTGRENVYLNARILGLSDRQVDERFDRIAAFADIGDFLEQPVKTYSSGMYMRLAFAAAIHVDPDILIVDEALAVGDEPFQRKCFGRIEQIREQGGTVLFVSHSAGQITELCNRAVLLDHGEKLFEGDPKRVISYYQRLAYAPDSQLEGIRQEIRGLGQSPDLLGVSAAAAPTTLTPSSEIPLASEFLDPGLQSHSSLSLVSRGATIRNPRLLNRQGAAVNVLRVGERYRYCYDVEFERSVSQVRFGMMIKTVSGIELGGSTSHPAGAGVTGRAGEPQSVCFEFEVRLTPGTYFLNAGVTGWCDGQDSFLHRLVDALAFRVSPLRDRTSTGYLDFACRFQPLPENAQPHAPAS